LRQGGERIVRLRAAVGIRADQRRVAGEEKSPVTRLDPGDDFLTYPGLRDDGADGQTMAARRALENRAESDSTGATFAFQSLTFTDEMQRFPRPSRAGPRKRY
jgi:hypothetical protein